MCKVNVFKAHLSRVSDNGVLERLDVTRRTGGHGLFFGGLIFGKKDSDSGGQIFFSACGNSAKRSDYVAGQSTFVFRQVFHQAGRVTSMMVS